MPAPARSRSPKRKAEPLRIPRASVGWRVPKQYQLQDDLGSGSYGSVVRARDVTRDKLVAVKRIKHLFDNMGDCKRILREISILSRLRHPSVVDIYDATIPAVGNEIYIIMELCESDLRKLMKTGVELEPCHVSIMFYNLLMGLKYIHSAGIYHRDLKPANCLLNTDCSVKIADFGLARGGGIPRADDEEDGSDDTLDMGDASGLSGGPTPQIPMVPLLPQCVPPAPVPLVPSSLAMKRSITMHVVTRWYRAPEVILRQPYAQSIDMWSAGCIYAEMLQMLEGFDVDKRGPMFPGSANFLLTPGNRNPVHGDQLGVIFEVLGTPTAAELQALEGNAARSCAAWYAAGRGSGLRAKLPHVGDEDVLALLGRLLLFAPERRLSASEALAHPAVAAVRRPSAETTAAAPIRLDFDDQEMQEADLRRHYASEIRSLKEARCDAHSQHDLEKTSAEKPAAESQETL